MTGTSNPFDRHHGSLLAAAGADGRSLLAVAEQAMRSGWKAEEVAAALVELADNHMLSLLANRDLARDLADLRK